MLHLHYLCDCTFSWSDKTAANAFLRASWLDRAQGKQSPLICLLKREWLFWADVLSGLVIFDLLHPPPLLSNPCWKIFKGLQKQSRSKGNGKGSGCNPKDNYSGASPSEFQGALGANMLVHEQQRCVEWILPPPNWQRLSAPLHSLLTAPRKNNPWKEIKSKALEVRHF